MLARMRHRSILGLGLVLALALGCRSEAPHDQDMQGTGSSDEGGTDSTTRAQQDDTSTSGAGGSSDESGAPAGCGNGVVDEGEFCDHGPDNGVYQKCAADCQAYTGCGDGIVQRDGGEACDDGEQNGQYSYCTLDCSGLGEHCGDAIHQETKEECDDGNEVVGDGCNTGCLLGGQLISSWTYDSGEGLDEQAWAVGTLPDGRFYLAGDREHNDAMFVAFEADDSPPFYTYVSPYHTSAQYLSADTLPDGRVLVMGAGSSIAGIVILRVWFDLDELTQVPQHFLHGGGLWVSSAVSPDGGHALCNSSYELGVRFYGADAPDEPAWTNVNSDCRAVAADASRVIATHTESNGLPQPTTFIRAFDHEGSGQPDWSSEFTQGTNQNATSIALDSEGNILLAGVFEAMPEPGPSNDRPMLRKHDPNGETIWTTNAFFTSSSEWYDVTTDALDNVIVVGTRAVTVMYEGSEFDVNLPVVRKYSPDGDLIWSFEEEFDRSEPYTRSLRAVTVTPAGEVLAAGRRSSADEGRNMYVVRLTP